jgi:uncharacterized protein YjbI with pentapeptide repeats
MTINDHKDLVRIENPISQTLLVAMIKQEPTEITEVNDLEFSEGSDDLDNLVFATLCLSLGHQVSLVRHQHSPVPGIEIYMHDAQPSVATALYETLTTIKLNHDDLTWVHPEYKQQLDILLEEQLRHKQLLSVLIDYSGTSNFNPFTDLSGADLSGAGLKGVKLVNANLRATILANAELGYASLQEACLSEANLQNADLREADLRGSNLQYADLRGANLRHADLQGANLRQAKLQGSELKRANLQGADLTHAKLDDGTLLDDANLIDANLKEIEFHKNTMWLNIIGLHKAKGIPDKLQSHEKFVYGIELSKGIEELTQNNNLNKFRETYKKVISEIESKEITASLYNKLAWLGILYGYSDATSYEAALKSVDLMPSKGNYHDTLGFILALRGEYNSAIKEFQVALESDDVKKWPQSFIDRRNNWIKDLHSDVMPFQQKLFEVLRYEEL